MGIEYFLIRTLGFAIILFTINYKRENPIKFITTKTGWVCIILVVISSLLVNFGR
jgi:hypothetical protein